MKLSRRQFVKTSSTATLLVNDVLKSLQHINIFDHDQFDHSCVIIRPSDLLNLTYYFINLEVNKKFLGKTRKLQKIKNESNAYIIIQIPQQHVAEESECCKELVNGESIKKSFVSGYSYLSYVLKPELEAIPYTVESLLNWNQFDLITINHIDPDKYPSKFINTDSIGPEKNKLRPLNENLPFYIETTKNRKIPITFFEAPYKLILSPISPITRPLPHHNYHFQFTNLYQSQQVTFLNIISKNHIFRVNELWNNHLVFTQKDMSSDNLQISPPNFKVIGHIGTEATIDEGVELLPGPAHRAQLKKLTNLIEPNRDVTTKLFNISSLGISTSLKYSNLDPNDQSIVAWEQDIKLGRDNFVKITSRAIESPFGLKLYVSIVTERKIYDGVSFLEKRLFLEYITTERTFDDDFTIQNIPIKKVRANDKGFYFTEKQIGNSSVYEVFKENTNKDARGNLILFNYTIWDHDDNEFLITSPMTFILTEEYVITSQKEYSYTECIYNKEKKECLEITTKVKKGQSVNFKYAGQLSRNNKLGYQYRITRTDIPKSLIIVNKHRTENLFFYKIAFHNKKLSLTPKYQDNTKTRSALHGDVNTNHVAEVDYIHLISTYVTEDNTSPTTPILHHTKSKILQLDSVDINNKHRYFSYLKAYRINGYSEKNITKNYFQIVSQDVKSLVSINTYSQIIEEIENQSIKIKGKILNSTSPAVKTGLTYSSVGAYKNSILHKKNTKSVEFTKTSEINFDIDAEILSFNIADLLDEILPFDATPFYEAYEQIRNLKKDIDEIILQVEEVKAIIETAYQEVYKYKLLYEDLKVDLKNKVREYELLLKDNLKRYVKEEIDNFIENIKKEYQAELLLLDQVKIIITLIESDNSYKKCLRQVNPIIKLIDPRVDLVILKANIDKETYNISLLLNEESCRDGIKAAITHIFLTALIKFSEVELYDKLLQLHHYISQKIKQLISKLVIAEDEVYQIVIDALNIADGLINIIETKVNNADEIVNDIQEDIRDIINRKLSSLLNDPDLKKALTIISNYELYLKSLSYIRSITTKNIEKAVKDAENYFNQEFLKTLNSNANDFLKTIFIENGKLRNVQKIEQIIKEDYNSKVNKLRNFRLNIDDIANEFKDQAKKELKNELRVYEEITEKLQAINDIKSEIKNVEQDLKDEFKLVINSLKRELREIEEEIKRDAENTTLLKQYREIESAIKALLSPKSKIVSNEWNTNNLRSFGPFISNHNTKLSVEIFGKIEYRINKKLQPEISKYEYYARNEISDFALRPISALTVNIAKVKYITGSHVPDDFIVDVTDIRFSGALKFVEVFRDKLSKLSDYFGIDVNANGIVANVYIPLPTISAGVISFFNLAINVAIELPFISKKPMQLILGINGPHKMFNIVAYGFPGRGYFRMVIEPKAGLVGLYFLLEFGATKSFNLGTAKGSLYFFAGIYFEKIYNDVYLKAYVIAKGQMSILGIVSIHLTFVLMIESKNGSSLIGTCIVSGKIRICKFFKLRFRVSFTQEFGTPEEEDNQSAIGSNLNSINNIIDNDLDDKLDLNETYNIVQRVSKRQTPMNFALGGINSICTLILDISELDQEYDYYQSTIIPTNIGQSGLSINSDSNIDDIYTIEVEEHNDTKLFNRQNFDPNNSIDTYNRKDRKSWRSYFNSYYDPTND